jgi:hypothetical protein
MRLYNFAIHAKKNRIFKFFETPVKLKGGPGKVVHFLSKSTKA